MCHGSLKAEKVKDQRISILNWNLQYDYWDRACCVTFSGEIWRNVSLLYIGHWQSSKNLHAIPAWWASEFIRAPYVSMNKSGCTCASRGVSSLLHESWEQQHHEISCQPALLLGVIGIALWKGLQKLWSSFLPSTQATQGSHWGESPHSCFSLEEAATLLASSGRNCQIVS